MRQRALSEDVRQAHIEQHLEDLARVRTSLAQGSERAVDLDRARHCYHVELEGLPSGERWRYMTIAGYEPHEVRWTADHPIVPKELDALALAGLSLYCQTEGEE